MITPPPGVRVYLACGYTDMRKGMATLAMLVSRHCHMSRSLERSSHSAVAGVD